MKKKKKLISSRTYVYVEGSFEAQRRGTCSKHPQHGIVFSWKNKKIFEPRRAKTNILSIAPNEDNSACASAQADQSSLSE